MKFSTLRWTVLAACMALFGSHSAQAAGPFLYAVESSGDGLSMVDVATGTGTFIGKLDPAATATSNLFATPVALAQRPSDGALFAWNNSSITLNGTVSSGQLVKVDKVTGAGTAIGPAGGSTSLQSLAFSPSGKLYGLDTQIYDIIPATGATSFIANIRDVAGASVRVAGADFDHTGTLYGLGFDDRLYTINTTSGLASLIGTLSVDTGTPGSIVFDPAGKLIGSGFSGPLGNIIFDIDPATAVVSNTRSVSGVFAPQGMAYAVPEPGTYALLSAGLVLLMLARRRVAAI